MKKSIYLPLMMGDWLRGTRGMTAKMKGVYIGLLIYQYDTGFIPDDLSVLKLIEPEIEEVWVLLKDKFKEVEKGKLQNSKLEEIRTFWQKQSNNGKKGGRPKSVLKKVIPTNNPNQNPNTNLHNEYDYDIDLNNNLIKEYEETIKSFFSEKYLARTSETFPDLDMNRELQKFKLLCESDPDDYMTRDGSDLRKAFLFQLKNSKDKIKQTTTDFLKDI